MRRLFAQLAAWIDSESVRHYQNIIYAAYICAGVHAIVSNPPGAVTRVMGEMFDAIWTAMLIVCPLLGYLGNWLRRHNLSGLWVQLSGDIGFTFATWAYVAAIVQATYAKNATFAAWLAAAIGLCAIGVVVRDIRLLRHVVVRMAEIDREDEAG
ncbi:hypothetical protein ACHIPZ_25025 [Antrihabitans sp. NCIMB 15449]|uniref:Uncharacterized protein n=1 Tax=Antrihabitans spumae TaxID=3373370 RepID=A0ABW7JY44_9NOCA